MQSWFVFVLGALLILIQFQILVVATKQAASAYMDAASAKAFGRLQNQVSEIASLVRVLSTSSTLVDSDERTGSGRGIPLLKAVLFQLPQVDSIYVGYNKGSWLQVRHMNDLRDEQRERLPTCSAPSVRSCPLPTTPTEKVPWAAPRTVSIRGEFVDELALPDQFRTKAGLEAR